MTVNVSTGSSPGVNPQKTGQLVDWDLFAFAGLGARDAISEVFQENAASQGVSRKLGYHHDGISRDVLDGRAVTSDRLRLTRETWEKKSSPHGEDEGPLTLPTVLSSDTGLTDESSRP